MQHRHPGVTPSWRRLAPCVLALTAVLAGCGATTNSSGSSGAQSGGAGSSECSSGCLISSGKAHLDVVIHDPVQGEIRLPFDSTRVNEVGTTANIEKGNVFK